MMPSSFHASDDDKYAKFDAAKRGNAGPLKVTHPPCNPPSFDDDDKYSKSHKHVPESLKKYYGAIGLFNFLLEKIPLQFCSFFMCFVLATAVVFSTLGVVFDTNFTQRFAALQLEILGLTLLRRRIRLQNSVKGISGMTFVMYAATYFVRIGLSYPFGDWSFEWKDVDPDVSLGCLSLLLVLDIVKSIFWTHRATYQEDLDVFKAWYLIPGCWCLGLLLRPHFTSWSWVFSYCWGSCLYMDVLALMPQVVMMSRGGGNVETPIANFVAMTAISRCGDLLHSLLYLGHLRITEPFSYWMGTSMQFIHILLVGDFMYYYLKACASATGLLDSINVSDNV